MQVLFAVLAGLAGLVLLAILLTLVLVPLFRGIGWLIAHLFRFVGGEIRDALRVVGAVITGAIFSLLVVANILIFRWSASAHYGRAFSAEVTAGAASIYRILIGHPARLLGLSSLVDGIENRVPQAVAAAPTKDKPSKRTGIFENYRIIGSLAGGGSGGKLYIAEPDEMKRAAFARNGQDDVDQVVIKSFSLRDGSSLPQIVRESRSLDAAKKLGLVLDHELTPERFFYVMRYVPGESLGLVTQHLHAASPESGLSNAHLAKALGYVDGLLTTLQRYHEGGLWHKDVKPDNIIIERDGAHLVDFGLITPLRSAMTLTTHGTEYFRDPEMVRMALKGVKVHEVDGARFDVYAAGAVLYSVIENSFPAHGGLSQVTKRCPDALRWIVRRAMTEYDKRYPTASAMLADLRYLRTAPDPFAVKPAELPSMKGVEAPAEPVVEVRADEFTYSPPRRADYPRAGGPGVAARVAAGAAVAAAAAAPVAARSRPKLRVTNWWSGRYRLEDAPEGRGAPFIAAAPAVRVARAGSATPRASVAGGVRRPASEQLESARSRAAARRTQARARMHHRRNVNTGRRHASGVNAGVVASLFIFLVFCVGLAGYLITSPGHVVRVDSSVASAGRSSDGALATAGGATAGVSVASLPGAADRPAPAPEPALPKLDGRVMVVSDLTLPGDERAMSMVQSALAAMRQAGLRVSGTLNSLALEGEALESAQNLEAKAQIVRATRPLDSEPVGEELGRWLSDNDAADLLVWIEPPPAGSTQPGVFLFGTPEAMESMPTEVLSSIKQMFSWEG